MPHPSRSTSASRATPAARPAPATGVPAPTPAETLVAASAYALLPLRAFLGATFLYAGLQKWTDPGYFNSHATTYIGKQITAFAHGSPIQGFLLGVAAPHAVLFGWLVVVGELVASIAVLAGAATRIGAAIGILLNITFFLSASWHVYPYFYGSDLVFIAAWTPLLLVGSAGLPAVDTWLWQRYALALKRPPLAHIAWIFGPECAPRPATPGSATAKPGRHAQRRAAFEAARSRRSFLKGLALGIVGTGIAVWLGDLVHGSSAPAAPATGTGSATNSAAPVLAKEADVPMNSAVPFTIPSNGDPGVLVHLTNGRFVAYDATCTHAGCTVQYDSSQSVLVCPCHGAAFDPANNGVVLQGPAITPLTPVSIAINQQKGTITLQS
jgi:thiosulfate dehydrogenase [quinone] large subunit